MDFLSNVLYDFCKLHSLEFISADDLLWGYYHELTEYQRGWLEEYSKVWDVVVINEIEIEDQLIASGGSIWLLLITFQRESISMS